MGKRSSQVSRLHGFRLLSLAPLAPLAPAALAMCGCSPAAAPAPLGSPRLALIAPPEVRPPAAASTAAKEMPSGYDKPPPSLLDVLHAPSPPVPYASPAAGKLLLVSWVDYPPMSRVAEPFLRLAGVRVEPKNRSKHDTPGGYGIRPCARAYTLVAVPNGTEVHVALPQGGCPSSPLWSADGARFAFQNAVSDAVELWVGDAVTGETHRLPGVRLNPMLENAVQWAADQRSLLVKLVPTDLGAAPVAPVVPFGPSIQETNGEKGESSTYETRDTLSGAYDEALFEFYATSQLALVDASTGRATLVGKPAIYTEVEAAPGGGHVLIEAITKPYSYVTTYDRFGHDVRVLDLANGSARTLASLPVADRVPVHGVPKGPRHFGWRPTDPATLTWAEALDEGDWKVKVPARDKIMMQKAPFADPPTEIVRTEQRFNGFTWGRAPSLAFLSEYDDNRHWRRTFTLNVDDRTTKPRLLWDLSSDERYKSPGTIVEEDLPSGARVAKQDGDVVYLAGQGASALGDRPFLDRLNVKTRASERLFRSERTAYEAFVSFASSKPTDATFLTWHQSPTDPPNAFVRALGAPVVGAVDGESALTSTTTALTHMKDPVPAVRAIKKRLVSYKRADGTDLSFTLYTPPGYREGTRVPAILYAYPLDYADSKKAGQVAGSEQMFTRLRQHRLLLLAGYAIVDNAAFPIVGDPKKAYDTYLEQLVADAKAAVDKAVELGVVDPERVGITGHSHGALMTANLLAHSDIFRAGVATSGSYNKTLTPFGFQSERRSVWDAQSVYLKASPFFFADKLKQPILIMHGDDDANPGTTPLQAKKLYEAIRGNGGTARLVMLPHEPHWYTAMESNEQLVSEMLRWFDRYVKNAVPRERAVSRARP